MVNQALSTETFSLELTFPPLETPTVIKTLNNNTPSNNQTKTQISQEPNPLLDTQAQENHRGSLFTLRRLSKMEFRFAKEASWGN
jgi:hypothetical protein